MTKRLRILILDDEPADATLIKHELRRGGLTFRSKLVDNQEDFMKEIRQHPPDLILSDHGLPGFDGFTALALAREQRPGTPFIFVSGSRNLQSVIETLKQGADGYVFKDRLATSLVPAIRRILREAKRRGQPHPLSDPERQRLRELEAVLARLNEFNAVLLLAATWAIHPLLLG